MLAQLWARFRAFVAPFHDARALTWIAIGAVIVGIIDLVMVKTLAEWTIQEAMFIGLSVIACRHVLDYVNLREHVEEAKRGNVAAGLVFVGTVLFMCAILLALTSFAKAAPVPLKAYRYAPLLAAKQAALWPSAPQAYTLGGLVEQESCVSLKSKRCWNPRAELKTSREYGFGFGQITIAYRADGSVRFNKFAELKREYASLHAWAWSNRYDPGYQLAAIVEMTHGLWRRVPPAASNTAQWAFTLSSYNGGLSGLLQDRRFCANSSGCDPTKWFGNIETHSLKSRAPHPGYRLSFFAINRGYVRNVLMVRRAKYRVFWEKQHA